MIIFGEHLEGGSRIGGAGGTITSDDPHSPLGTLFGTAQARGTATSNPTEDNDPLSGGLEWLTAEFTGPVQWTKCVRNESNPCSPEDHADPCAVPEPERDPLCDPCADPELLDALCEPTLLGAGAAPFAALVLTVIAGAAATWVRKRRLITPQANEGRKS